MVAPEPEGKQCSLPNPGKITPERYWQAENQILQTEVLKLREEVDRLKTRLGVVQGRAIAVSRAATKVKADSTDCAQLILAVEDLEQALWS